MWGIFLVSFILWITLFIKRKYPRLFTTILLGTFSIILIYLFALIPMKITGSSMEPTLRNKEYVLMEKISYLFRNPTRKEIVIYSVKNDLQYVGRVIGLPKEQVTIRNNVVSINDISLQESNVDWSNFQKNGPIEVDLGENEYYVMMDKRSGYSNIVNINDIQGKLFFRFSSL